MQTLFRSIVLAALFVGSATTLFAGELKLTLANGRVTILAQDVPVRQILDEWARVGQTRIVNADKLAGPSVTLQLVDVPEAQALETLLRSASGYVAAQRATYVAGASVFDRVMIMPTSRPPAASAAAPPPSFNQPARPQPMPDVDDDPADAPVVMPPGMQPPPNPNGMPPGVAPGAQPQNPQQPMTAPRPGLLPAPPTGQPQPAPGTSPTPGVRPPGGPGGGPGGEGIDR